MYKLVTEEPDILENDYKRCFKYPFLACETLCSNNEALIKQFLDIGKENEGRRFTLLFNVLKIDEYDDEVNSTLTGYVSRIAESVIQKFPELVI